MSKARIRNCGSVGSLRRTDLEQMIYEANLGEENTYIAKRYFIDQIAQIDIAFEMSNRSGLEFSRSTVSRRLDEIRRKLECT